MSAGPFINHKTIDGLMEQCVEEGDCMIWTRGTTSSGTPQIRLKSGMTTVLRLVWCMTKRVELESIAGQMVWASCSVKSCCAAKHLMIGTRPHYIAWRKSRGLTKHSPAAIAKQTASIRARPKTKLTMEVARELRASPESSAQAAERLGVDRSTVIKIRAGKWWRESTKASSIFAGALA